MANSIIRVIVLSAVLISVTGTVFAAPSKLLVTEGKTGKLWAIFGVEHKENGKLLMDRYEEWDLKCDRKTHECSLDSDAILPMTPGCSVDHRHYSTENGSFILKRLNLAAGLLLFDLMEPNGERFHASLSFSAPDRFSARYITGFKATGLTASLDPKAPTVWEFEIPKADREINLPCRFILQGYQSGS